MGKRLAKSELLEEIRDESEALDELLAQLTPRQMTNPGVTAAGWSVKDILGHLVGWQQLLLGWYEAGERGETPPVPAPSLTWKDVPRLNQRIYRQHRRRALAAVLADYAAYHQRMLDLIQKAPEARFTRVGRYAWAGPTWTLSDYIRANTASHYRWAQKHIRRWMRQQTTWFATLRRSV